MLHVVSDAAQIFQRGLIDFEAEILETLTNPMEVNGPSARYEVDASLPVEDRFICCSHHVFGIRVWRSSNQHFLGEQQNTGVEIPDGRQRTLRVIRLIIFDTELYRRDCVVEQGVHSSALPSFAFARFFRYAFAFS